MIANEQSNTLHAIVQHGFQVSWRSGVYSRIKLVSEGDFRRTFYTRGRPRYFKFFKGRLTRYDLSADSMEA